MIGFLLHIIAVAAAWIITILLGVGFFGLLIQAIYEAFHYDDLLLAFKPFSKYPSAIFR